MIRFTFFLCLVFLVSCTNSTEPKEEQLDLPNPENFIQAKVNYLEGKDFDQDSISDCAILSYTNGAHCCYQLHLKLSSLADTIHYPFEIDGGLSSGIIEDGIHDLFDIDDFDDDGSLEIFMGINTYNGQEDEIPQEYKDKYGFNSNYILIDYVNKKVVLSDYDRDIHMKK